jgi:hypothetical protein
MITDYTRDEYFDMLFTLGACDSRSGDLASRYPGRRRPDAYVFLRLQ